MKLETFYDDRSSSGTYCPNGEITYDIFHLIVSCAYIQNKKTPMCFMQTPDAISTSWNIREQIPVSRVKLSVHGFSDLRRL